MKRTHDKYGRGSAAANGIGFVDLEPGDTFDGLEARLRAIKDSVFECRRLGLRASVGSMRNANELAKHLAKGELEEVHKFAAKNLGVLFSRAGVGIRHLDKKADPNARWVITYVRVFAWFVFDGDRKLATITLKQNHGQHNFYSVEALEINKDAESERTPRGAISEDLNSAPLQNLASQLANKITYYVGDVKRTKPSFVASEEPFSVERAASEILKTNGDQTMAGTDISVIILIGQEKIHLKRCIERLAPLEPRCIWLIESQPDDGGVAIAKETAEKLGLTLKTVYNKWPGLHAKQLNWAIDNLPIETTWILRLDADEYLYPETCEEVKRLVTDGVLPPDVTSLSLSREFFAIARSGSAAQRTFRWFASSSAALGAAKIMRWTSISSQAKGATIVLKASLPTTISTQWIGGARSTGAMRSARRRMRSRSREARFISSLRKKPTTKCRVISAHSSTSPFATFSRAASSTATAAGCGTSGKVSGIAGLWIGR